MGSLQEVYVIKIKHFCLTCSIWCGRLIHFSVGVMSLHPAFALCLCKHNHRVSNNESAKIYRSFKHSIQIVHVVHKSGSNILWLCLLTSLWVRIVHHDRAKTLPVIFGRCKREMSFCVNLLCKAEADMSTAEIFTAPSNTFHRAPISGFVCAPAVTFGALMFESVVPCFFLLKPVETSQDT